MRYLFLLLLITSCASRKVVVEKEVSKTTLDSTAITKVDSTSITKNNVSLIENSEELEIKPVVYSLPIVVNGISYKNAILTYKKKNKVLVDQSIKKDAKIALKKVVKHKKEIKKIKNKTIDKKANYFVYLWLLLIPVGMYIYRQVKNKLLL